MARLARLVQLSASPGQSCDPNTKGYGGTFWTFAGVTFPAFFFLLPGSFHMFVKWSCGCKGFIFNNECWVITACDSDYGTHRGPLGIWKRDMTDQRRMILSRDERQNYTEEQLSESVPKLHEPLPPDEVAKLLIQLNRLVMNGYDFRHIQYMLSNTWPSTCASD